MPKSPEILAENKTQSAIDFYKGICPNPDCQKPSLDGLPRPADENIGPGPIFVKCQECGWVETGIDYEERTGKKLW